jgi:hypothetical protein
MHKKMEASIQWANEAHKDYKQVTDDFMLYKTHISNQIRQWRDKDKSVLDRIHEKSVYVETKCDDMITLQRMLKNDVEGL